MNIPKINIRYGKLIDPFIKDSVSLNYPDYQFPEINDVKQKVNSFRKIWEKEGINLFSRLIEKSGLEFKRNIIDCFIVSATPRDMSAPLIIRSRYNKEEFLYVILHELLHKLFVDNKVKRVEDYDESKTTLDHVQIFALIRYLYVDIYNDEDKLQKIIRKYKDDKKYDYVRAWEIVDNLGYENIIKNHLTPLD